MNHCLLKIFLSLAYPVQKKKRAEGTKMTRLFWESADVNNYHARTASAAQTQHNGSAIITALHGRRNNSMAIAKLLLRQLQHTFWLGKGIRSVCQWHNNTNIGVITIITLIAQSVFAKTTVWFAEKWEQQRKATVLASPAEFNESRSVSYCLSAE